jgi:CubicO group peptidase (beta-lactamase class C family)
MQPLRPNSCPASALFRPTLAAGEGAERSAAGEGLAAAEIFFQREGVAHHCAEFGLRARDVERIEPLYPWRGGEAIAACGLRMTPRDLARIGLMMLQGGSANR